MSTTPMSKSKLTLLVLSRLVFAIPIMMALFFIPAGTWNYWQAWVFLVLLFGMMFFVFIYLLQKKPDLLERRMQMREREQAQRKIIWIALLYYPAIFLLPGLDVRFGWSNPPVWVVLAADGVFILGYCMFIWVMRTNSFAARTVEVQENQQVITTGPYAIVRHPMYVGVTLMYIFLPLALGSYWAMIPAILILPILVFRILNEEQVLMDGLHGYREYMEKTHWRLIPGIW